MVEREYTFGCEQCDGDGWLKGCLRCGKVTTLFEWAVYFKSDPGPSYLAVGGARTFELAYAEAEAHHQDKVAAGWPEESLGFYARPVTGSGWGWGWGRGVGWGRSWARGRGCAVSNAP